MTKMVKRQYNEALKDLKNINDDLFYDDLKAQMNKHLELLQNESNKIENTIVTIKSTLENLTGNILVESHNAKSALIATSETVDQKIKDSFEQQNEQIIENMNNIFVAFQSIGDEQKDYIEKELLPVVNTYLQKIDTLQKQQAEQLEALTIEQNQYISKKEEIWKIEMEAVEQKWLQQLKDIKTYYEKKFEQLFMNTETVEKTFLNTLETHHHIVQSNTLEVKKALNQLEQFVKVEKQHITTTFTQLQNAINSHEQENASHFDEIQKTLTTTKQTYEVQIGSQQELLTEQSTQFKLMFEKQISQGSILQKGLISLSISQIVTLGVIIFLYFF